LYLPGAVAIWSALIFALAGVWGYSQALAGDASAIAFSRRAYACFAAAIGLTALMLILVLLMRDFRIEYVFQYSGLDLPGHYQFASFWAGQKGSFLIWLFWGTMLGLLVQRTAGKSEASVMVIYIATLLGLIFILVRQNPFVMLAQSPVDGQGLNPLLQDDWMVIHPPIMFIGYAATAIPFAFAMASLWRRDYDGWAARAFPWALFGFLVLGCAILMGGYWAYKTLGWGGFWGWDPVENASLIPWLCLTVLVHGLHMERTRKRFRRANYVIASMAYLAVLYGTFLTRSGVLADFSVHSFVDLGISRWLIALMATFVGLSIWLLATRLRKVPTEANEDPILSRGTFLVLATIAISISALVITFGTSAPLLTRLRANPGQVGPEWYNLVNKPIAIAIAVLLTFLPYLTWKGDKFGDLIKKMVAPLIGGTLIAVAFVAWKVHDALDIVLVLFAALALATNLHKTISKWRVGGLRAAGGYLAHAGVGMMLLGILASSAYDESTKLTLEQGKPVKSNGRTYTFTRYLPPTEEERRDRMEIQVVEANGDSYSLYPRMFLNQRTQQLMVNPDIKKRLSSDLYISPIQYDPGQPQLALSKGQEGKVGDVQVKFEGFDLNANGNALAQMASGKQITIGTVFDVTRNGQTTKVRPVYRLNPANGQVETPATDLPGGGAIRVAGINASAGNVQIEIGGVANPAKLAVDVTTKPLIEMVWFGLYLMLIGGGLAMILRFRDARVLERVAERAA
ncbi:MAG TPA: cytochrome c-type biogenesis CcmF C-terminal domain-containing protein, partial [Thermoanaerobaculia bacterium]|nr:cytochrome c-type biogenesis CcmF C-terminal domain-containing protein [Thermoanaerobaculia bacterium]